MIFFSLTGIGIPENMVARTHKHAYSKRIGTDPGVFRDDHHQHRETHK